MEEKFTKKEAIKFLCISEKDFKNYFESSEEIHGSKIGAKWYFDKNILADYKKLKEQKND